MKLRLFVCLLGLLGLTIPARADAVDPTKAEDVFGLTKLWSMHLTVQAEDWEKMQPARGGFNRARKDAPQLSDDRKPRGGFGYDFEYVKGDLEINGKLFKDVGVRFKGNSTYMLTSSYLKRPFKIDLDRHNEEQTWGGLKKLTLNNNVMDPTATRESLAFMVYRAAGVPAPRTAFLELSLTVPGKYDNVLVGTYTLVETVDKTFLKNHFPSAKGLLCKPERVGALQYLGENWSSYESTYRPKSTPSKAAQRRLIEFTRLVQQGTEVEFFSRIASFLDVDLFLRYTAATVVLSSMDSFVGLGHNFYLYLDPKSDKFVILPWDVDHSFGALTMVGSQHDLFQLSMRKPTLGNNRLVERLLSDRKLYAEYRDHVARLLETTFTNEWVKSNAETISKTISESREREKKAIADRGEAWNTWKVLEVFNPPPTVETFAARRIESLQTQLAGKSEGRVLRNQRASNRPEAQVVSRMLTTADVDKDGSLSRDEMLTGLRELFQHCDPDNKGELDQKQLTGGLEKLLPRPGGFFGPPSPAGPLARGIFARAASADKLTLDDLVKAAENLFDQTDRMKKGMLDEQQLNEAMRVLLGQPRPPFADRAKKN